MGNIDSTLPHSVNIDSTLPYEPLDAVTASQTPETTKPPSPEKSPRNNNQQLPNINNFFSGLFGDPEEGEPVVLHVYAFPTENNPYLAFISAVGLGAHHSGVEIYGSEYVFEGGPDDRCGIYKQKPKTIPAGVGWQYKESIVLGKTKKTRQQVISTLKTLGPLWPRKSYHVITRNCNHFTDEFCLTLLGRGIPGWVNRLAGAAETIVSLKGPIPTQEEIMMRMASTNLPPQDLLPYLVKEKTVVFNQHASHPIDSVVFGKCSSIPLKSKDGPKLLIIFKFAHPVTVDKIDIGGPKDGTAPKTVQIFFDMDTLRLNTVDKARPIFQAILKPTSQAYTTLIPPNVHGTKTLTIYIPDNEADGDITQISVLDLWGVPS